MQAVEENAMNYDYLLVYGVIQSRGAKEIPLKRPEAIYRELV
jgi:hypothetical protein